MFSFHRIYSSYYVYGRVCTACGHDGNTRGRCEFGLWKTEYSWVSFIVYNVFFSLSWWQEKKVVCLGQTVKCLKN